MTTRRTALVWGAWHIAVICVFLAIPWFSEFALSTALSKRRLVSLNDSIEKSRLREQIIRVPRLAGVALFNVYVALVIWSFFKRRMLPIEYVLALGVVLAFGICCWRFVDLDFRYFD